MDLTSLNPFAMRALHFSPPGGPEKLTLLTDHPTPTATDLKPDELLVNVHAAGLIWTELFWPIYQDTNTGAYRTHIPGRDFSGVVVNGIKAGDEVFGMISSAESAGAMAEYVVVHRDAVALKPKNLSWEEAAAVPLSALTAWQAFKTHSSVMAGTKVLVTGAAGGTGVFAVPLAKMMGAKVVGTAGSKEGSELLRKLDVDKVVDYKTEDLVEVLGEGSVNVVLDTVGGEVFEKCLKVVKKEDQGGMLVSINTFDAEARAKDVGVKAKFFIVTADGSALAEIGDLLEQGKLEAFVDTVFPLEKAVDAWKQAMDGHVHGKIVVRVARA